jgi:cytochrome b
MAIVQITEQETLKVWDFPLRLFHWVLVLTIAFAFISAEEGSLSSWHITAGWVAALLIIFRIVWGFVGGEHARFRDFLHPTKIGGHIKGLIGRRGEASLGHNALGGIAILAMLALVVATVWSGATMQGEAGEELHETIGYSLLALIAVHVIAVVMMSIWNRENLIVAMISGRKPAHKHPGASHARAPRLLSYLAAAMVVAAGVYLIRDYDPAAFQPHPLEEEEATTAVPRGHAVQHEPEDEHD